ncbi:MAG: TolC family protein, partial [Thermodesulfovibrionales bacterium]|nr:TolC family protein [Thermodesulfovibrionales bacterium]
MVLLRILLFFSFSVFFVFRQVEAVERKLTLVEAIQIALNQNHEIRAFDKSILSATADVSISKSYLLPKITFEERFMRTNNPTYSFMAKLNQSRFMESDFYVPSLNNPNAINDFQSAVFFEQPLFVQKAYLGIDISKRELDAKKSDIKRKKEAIILKVLQAYAILSTSKEYFSSSQKTIEEAREHLRIAELRYKNNVGLFSDTLRAQTSLKEAEQNNLKAMKNINLAKRSLGLLLGLSDSVDIVDADLPLALHPYEYYEKHSTERADLISMKLKVENAKKNISLAESEYYPIIALGGTYQLNDHRIPFGSEGSSWQIAAFLRWNIFDGTKRENERAKAKYMAQEAIEHLEGMKKGIAYKVYEAYQNYEEAKKSYDIALKALETAEEGMRLVRVRYENSLSPIVDLLSAQTSLDYAR